MIDSLLFINSLAHAGIRLVVGVPDSLLKEVCKHFSNILPGGQHVIATNEGSAIALAIGHYLATRHPALVYMQNSGLGNAINPLISLADANVYAIPMMLMIGWRGEVFANSFEQKDEPQHIKQGQITLAQLDILNIPYLIIDGDSQNLQAELQDMVNESIRRSGPVALIVRKGSFLHDTQKLQPLQRSDILPKREEVICTILDLLPEQCAVISTTGMASREVFEIRKLRQQGHHRDFLVVGGMGHASQIAAGVAMSQPDRPVVCIDGDGASLMHLGALANSADYSNLIHILINNEAHDSVGGQPTKGSVLNFAKIASSLGYKNTIRVLTLKDLKRVLSLALINPESTFIEIKCKLGSRKNLGRPDCALLQRKSEFMNFLKVSE